MFPSSRERYQTIFHHSTTDSLSPVASWKGGPTMVENKEYQGWSGTKTTTIPTTFRSSLKDQGSTTGCSSSSTYHLSNSSWSLIQHSNLQGPLPESFEPQQHPYTVIVGRGSTAKSNLGNKRLRILASNYLSLYATTPIRKVKTQVVNEIFNTIQHAGGMFVIQREDKRWYQASDTVAREKIGYILRDMLSDEYKSSSKSKMLAARRKRKEGKHHHYFFVSSCGEKNPDDDCHQPHHPTSRVRFSMCVPDNNRSSIFSLDQEEPDEPYSHHNESDFLLQPSIVPPPSFPTRGTTHDPDLSLEYHHQQSYIQNENKRRLDTCWSAGARPIPSTSSWDSGDEEPLCFSFN